MITARGLASKTLWELETRKAREKSRVVSSLLGAVKDDLMRILRRISFRIQGAAELKPRRSMTVSFVQTAGLRASACLENREHDYEFTERPPDG